MSNAIFPTLPGLMWGVLKTPTWVTAIQTSVSGKEVRTAYRDRPIWKFALSYEFLRSVPAYGELQTLMAFFNSRKGSFDSFLFMDADDNTATAQSFGIGNGVKTSFPLMHV